MDASSIPPPSFDSSSTPIACTCAQDYDPALQSGHVTLRSLLWKSVDVNIAAYRVDIRDLQPFRLCRYSSFLREHPEFDRISSGTQDAFLVRFAAKYSDVLTKCS